ncbi:deaminase [Rhodococcus cerastii]|nr:deaminase [Rhodococcus cerastii]
MSERTPLPRPATGTDDPAAGTVLPGLADTALTAAMRAAVDAARAARRPFGAALIDLASGRLRVCRANSTRETGDRFAHAEMNTLRAGLRNRTDLSGHVLVATAEPCPMCAAASVFAGVDAIVYGTSIATLAALGWKQILLSTDEVLARSTASPITVRGGYLRADTDPLYRTVPGIER